MAIKWLKRSQFEERIASLEAVGSLQFGVRLAAPFFHEQLRYEGCDITAEETMPSRTLRWYATLGRMLLFVDVLDDDKCFALVTTGMPLNFGATKQGIAICEISHQLKAIGVTYIECVSLGTHSIYFRDEQEIDIPVWTSDDEQEIEGLCRVLCRSFELPYFVDHAEPDATWLIQDVASGCIEGQYSSRSAALRVACRTRRNLVVSASDELPSYVVSDGRVCETHAAIR